MALLLLLACLKEQPIAPEDSGTVVDDDGDGWIAAEDCDDTNADVNPDAEELCNGIDDNCDALIDEDAVDRGTFYRDADSDGFGDAEQTTEACVPAEGWVEDDQDCDDSDDSVYPDAEEICDYLDNDCDGETDEDGLTVYYMDGDADGYGDVADEGEETCGVPEGKVADNTDCDDGRWDTNPGADEYCNDIDDDCDGEIDPDTSVDAPTWYIDADSDSYGSVDYTAVQCDAPEGYVADDTDCDDLDDEVNPGQDELCNGIDDDCDGDIDEDDALDASIWYADTDGDGYGDGSAPTVACDQPTGQVADGSDCDDGNSDVNPGEDELCSTAADDDCDGDANEDDAVDATTWYDDDDGDGYGEDGTSTTACDQPTGTSSTGGDCDDSDADAYPGADEYCDGHDDDCDGDVDEDDAVDATTWYGDDDEDGYGEDTDTTTACDEPAGYSASGGDCDDGDDDIYPGADEYCNSEDDDCDGDVDEDDAIDATTWNIDSDGDGYGDSSTTTEACEEPSGYVEDDTDCDDAESAVNPGETEVCGDGLDNDCDGAIGADCGPYGTVQLGTTREAKISGEDSYGYLGYAVGAGDVDGDGYDDVVVSAPYTGYGEAYLFYGPISGDLDSGDADFTVAGTSYYGFYDLAVVGDLNGDGDDDLALASPQYSSDGKYNIGLVSLFYGPGTGSANDTDGDALLYGAITSDFLGSTVADLGDMDGDGNDDLVVGSPYNSTYAGNAGVYYGPITSDVQGVASDRLEGIASYDYLGGAVAGGDVDGDGTPDLLAGAYGADAAYVLYGPVTTTVSATDADVTLSGSSGDYSGQALDIVEDMDADGYDEVVVSAPYYSSYTGYTFVLNGPVTADATLASDYDARFVGSSSSYGGRTVAGCDIDGDGNGDLIVGAPGTGTWKGKAYLFLGPLTATSYVMASTAAGTIAGEGSNEYAAHINGLACGDTDADGNDDIVVGAYGNDEGATNAGAAYIVLGGEGL